MAARPSLGVGEVEKGEAGKRLRRRGAGEAREGGVRQHQFRVPADDHGKGRVLEETAITLLALAQGQVRLDLVGHVLRDGERRGPPLEDAWASIRREPRRAFRPRAGPVHEGRLRAPRPPRDGCARAPVRAWSGSVISSAGSVPRRSLEGLSQGAQGPGVRVDETARLHDHDAQGRGVEDLGKVRLEKPDLGPLIGRRHYPPIWNMDRSSVDRPSSSR